MLAFVLRRALPELRAAMFWTAPGLVARFAALLIAVLLAVLAVQGAFALVDFAWTLVQVHPRPAHEPPGHPRGDARIGRRPADEGAAAAVAHAAGCASASPAAVPKATVVVTNPTHYAVALAYDRAGRGRPRVVAKGVDEVAARIRAVAEENKVPLVANPPLARALYRVELDAEIPAELFQAVAEIIAYVLRLARHARPARG